MDAADGQAQPSRSIARNGAGTSWYCAAAGLAAMVA